MDLRRAVGSPPQSTMRKQLRTLTELGVLERRQQEGFPGSVEYELGRQGRELLVVADVAQEWLAAAPEGAPPLGSAGAKSLIKALVEGWNSAILRAIAARPMTLTELNKLISTLNYPSLERRLGALRLARLIEAREGQGRGTPYGPTRWLRGGIGLLVAAANWERGCPAAGAPPPAKIDVEAVFLLTVPALRLPSDLSGSCRFAVELRSGSAKSFAGVLVEVEEGRVVSCVSRLQGQASAWASGSAGSWLDAVRTGNVEALEIGGDCNLALSLLDSLRLDRADARQPV